MFKLVVVTVRREVMVGDIRVETRKYCAKRSDGYANTVL